MGVSKGVKNNFKDLRVTYFKKINKEVEDINGVFANIYNMYLMGFSYLFKMTF